MVCGRSGPQRGQGLSTLTLFKTFLKSRGKSPQSLPPGLSHVEGHTGGGEAARDRPVLPFHLPLPPARVQPSARLRRKPKTFATPAASPRQEASRMSHPTRCPRPVPRHPRWLFPLAPGPWASAGRNGSSNAFSPLLLHFCCGCCCFPTLAECDLTPFQKSLT